jgi:predicted MFS family arabinose efflux permease
MNRAIIAMAAVAVGWTLMVVAYDKPEWYFQVIGVAGFLFVVCALVWWFASARRAKAIGHHQG